MKAVKWITISCVFVGVLLGGFAITKKNIHIWLSDYVIQKVSGVFLKNNSRPKHIMFAFVDHFEPYFGGVSNQEAKAKMERWSRDYPLLAQKHKDADGVMPQHTWFYPQDMIQEDLHFLKELVKLQRGGFGEIEMHLHHQYDTSLGLMKKVGHWKSSMGIVEGGVIREHFAFVAGNWALDNSRSENGKNYCGVNNEITILKKYGCYADYTFPSVGHTSQPSMVNTIFYATDDPLEPKSYDRGVPVEVGKEPSGDLMLIPGAMELRWYFQFGGLKPSIDDSNICETFLPFKERVDTWIESNIHVKGQPAWVFVKVHTHGCEDAIMPVVLGKPVDDMHTYLETHYNDGENYVLHYVTAREMYNIIKAAEAGNTGDPNQYRDFSIKPY